MQILSNDSVTEIFTACPLTAQIVILRQRCTAKAASPPGSLWAVDNFIV